MEQTWVEYGVIRRYGFHKRGGRRPGLYGFIASDLRPDERNLFVHKSAWTDTACLPEAGMRVEFMRAMGEHGPFAVTCCRTDVPLPTDSFRHIVGLDCAELFARLQKARDELCLSDRELTTFVQIATGGKTGDTAIKRYLDTAKDKQQDLEAYSFEVFVSEVLEGVRAPIN